MRDAVLAAVVCGCAAVTGWTLWTVLDTFLGGALVVPGLDARLTRLVLAPPLVCLAATAVLALVHVERPWPGPLLGGLTVAVVSVVAARLLALLSVMLGISTSRAVLVLFAASAGWWGWVVVPGRSVSLRVACPVLLLALALVDRAFAAQLELAFVRREIVATGLRPWVVDDPAWVLDYVYVPPDRRSISVGYESPERDNSLSVELVRVDAGAPGGPQGVAAAVRAVPRYVARVEGDQMVRMELDHGEAHDPEIVRLAARLRPADPAELARRDAAGLV